MSDTGPYVIEHGDTWFRTGPSKGGLGSGLRHICGPSELLAVAFDSDDGMLHKHGTAEMVTKWADNAREKLKSNGLDNWAQNLVVLSFPPMPEALEELNACIACTGRILGFQNRLESLIAPPRPSQWP